MVGAADKRRGGERQRGESVFAVSPSWRVKAGIMSDAFPRSHIQTHIVTNIYPLSIDMNATSSLFSFFFSSCLYLVSACNPFS